MTDQRSKGRFSLLDVIVVNWNSGRQLYHCLAALQKAQRIHFQLNRVCVVDNASTDDSLAGIEEIDLPLEVIRNRANRGFGAAVNQAAGELTCDYLLLLNPDTKVFANSLDVSVAFLEKPQNAAVGIVGIQNVTAKGAVMRTCARFPTPEGLLVKSLGLNRLFPTRFSGHFMSEWDHRDSRAVDHVMGSFFLVRRVVWQSLGGFDDRFFMYLEDVDFSKRAKDAGYTTVFLSEAQVYHRGGGTSEQAKAHRLFYSRRSALCYAHKHFSPAGALVTAGVILLIEPWARCAGSLFRMRPSEIAHTLQGYQLLYRDLPNLCQNLRGL